jgi:hypothetical protein
MSSQVQRKPRRKDSTKNVRSTVITNIGHLGTNIFNKTNSNVVGQSQSILGTPLVNRMVKKDSKDEDLFPTEVELY